MSFTITVCGGGNGAHVCVGYLGRDTRYTINLLTRRPYDWKNNVTVRTKDSTWEYRGDFVGRLNKVSDNPSDVIPQANVVLIAAPANAHYSILRAISPYTRDDAIVGTIFGQGTFDLAARAAFGERFKTLGALFGLQNIPWLCRTIEYGSEVQLIGPKMYLVAASYPSTPQTQKRVCNLLTNLFDIPAQSAPNFLTLWLTPSNQIIHPARYYEIFKEWDGNRTYSKKEISWGLYTEFGDEASTWLQRLDDELQAIKTGLLKLYDLDLSLIQPIRDRIVRQYGNSVADKSSLKQIFRTNKAYAGCVTPAAPKNGGFIPAIQSRLFWEDIPYGLCALKSLAQHLKIETPSIDFMIEWHQQFMGKTFLKNGRLAPETVKETAAPEAYGITTLDEIVETSLRRELRSKL